MANVDWHMRYTEQGRWTADLRRYLYQQIGLSDKQRVLEVGCGTGAILGDFPTPPFGIDISFANLCQARSRAPGGLLCAGDALHLPYAQASFDITTCHFLLLWLSDPLAALNEMRRVTRPGGWVLACAEPDYSARIDSPAELAELSHWQIESLRQQGAEPGLGRRLGALFVQAGLRQVKSGIMGGQWSHPQLDSAAEWEVLLADIEKLAQPPCLDEVVRLQKLDESARQEGARVLFVPTFYAWGLAG